MGVTDVGGTAPAPDRAARSRRRALAAHVAAAGRALGEVAHDRSLRRVQLAWTGCITAEWGQTVALAVVAYAAGGPSAVGALVLVRSLPAAVIGPFAAGLADRYPRERVLFAVLLARTAILGAIAVVLQADGPLGLVFGLAALDATVYSLFWPAHSALLPALASTPERLTAANVSSTTIENLGGLVGPLLSGVALAVATPAVAVALASGTLALSALAIAPVRVPRAPVPDEPDGGHPLLAGFRVLRHQAEPRLVVCLYLAQTLCLGALGVLVVVVAIDVHDAGEPTVGYLHAAIGAGGMLGALGSMVLVGRPHMARVFLASLLLWGLAMTGTAVAPAVVPAAVLLALLGAGNALVDVAAITLLQRLVDGHVLARVLGVFEGLWWAMLGLGGVLASVLVDGLGARPAIAAVGALLPLLALVTWAATARLDQHATIRARDVELLGQLPMFRGLGPRELEGLALAVEVVDVAPGTCIIREGDVGDRFYVIDQGEVEIVARSGTTRFGPGSHFGEIALLRSVPRTATVTAVTATSLLALDRDDFLGVLAGHRPGWEAADAAVDEMLA
jgi:MFS family permease